VTVEYEPRAGGGQLRRHPNLYVKLTRALQAQGKYRGPAPTAEDQNERESTFAWQDSAPAARFAELRQ